MNDFYTTSEMRRACARRVGGMIDGECIGMDEDVLIRIVLNMRMDHEEEARDDLIDIEQIYLFCTDME